MGSILSAQDRERAVKAARKAGWKFTTIANNIGGKTTSKNLSAIVHRGSMESEFAELLDKWLIKNRFAIDTSSNISDFRNRIFAILDMFDDPSLSDSDKIGQMLTSFDNITKYVAVINNATTNKP